MSSKLTIKVFIISFSRLCVLLLAFMSLYAQAYTTLSVDADSVISNNTTKKTIYLGNVIVNYDNNQLLTPEMIIYKDNEEQLVILANGAKDDPVQYKQIGGKAINVTALNVRYTDADKTFIFSGKVVAVTIDSNLKADEVVYNSQTGEITSQAYDNNRISTQFNFN